VVATEGKRTLRGLFSQRVGWSFGLAQVFFRDFDRIRRASAGRPLLTYHLLVYAGLAGLLLQPVRALGVGVLCLSLLNGVDNVLRLGWIPDGTWTHPLHLVATYVHYTLLVVAQVFIGLRRRERRRVWPIVPLYFVYALAQTLPSSIGYLNWISLRLIGRRLYRDHYQADDVLIRQQMAAA
jgi:hypothetical protein